jgi:hypothetical protein
LKRPGDRVSVVVDQTGIGTFQERFERGGLVGLTGCEMEVQRMTVSIAEQMDFG